jgi:hypothetical protein
MKCVVLSLPVRHRLAPLGQEVQNPHKAEGNITQTVRRKVRSILAHELYRGGVPD